MLCVLANSMKKYLYLFPLLSLLFALPAKAQQDFPRLYESMIAAYKAGDVRQAAHFADSLRVMAGQALQSKPEQLAALYQNMAVIYMRAQRLPDAEEMFKASMALRKKQDMTAYFSTAFQLAALYVAQDRHTEAESIYKEVVQLSKQQTQQTIYYPLALSYLGQLAIRRAAWDEAASYFAQADTLFRQAQLTARPEYAYVLIGKGHLLVEQGNYTDAKPLLQQGMQLAQAGKANDLQRQALLDLALIDEEEGQTAKAIEHLENLLLMADMGSIEAVAASVALARLYVKSANYAKAEQQLRTVQGRVEAVPRLLPDYYQARAMLATARQEYTQALAYLDKMESLTQGSATWQERLTLLYNRVQVERALELWVDAMEHVHEAVQLMNKNKAQQEPLYARIYCLWGEILEKGMQDYEAAADKYKVAMDSWKRIHGTPTLAYWLTAADYARTLMLARKYREAEKEYERLLPALVQLLGTEARAYADALSSFANLLYEIGDYKRAEDYYRQAIDIYKKNFAVGELAYIAAVRNLAAAYANRGLYGFAQELYVEAMTEAATTLGEVHPFYLDLSEAYALLLQNMGYYDVAEQILLQNLSARQRLFGEEHLAVGETYLHLGVTNYLMGSYVEAEEFLNKARTLYEQQGAKEIPDYADVLYFLAKTLNKMGRANESIKLLQQSLMLRERIAGPQHPDYALALNALAAYHEQVGNYTEAQKLYQQALGMLRAKGEYSPEYIGVSERLANLYKKQNKLQEAIDLLKKAYDARLTLYGKLHPATAASANNLAILLEAVGKSTDALRYYTEALRALEETVGKQHPDYITTLNNLAILYDEQKNYAQAALYYEQSVDVLGNFIKNIFPGLSEKEKRSFYYKYRPFYENFFFFVVKHAAQKIDAALSHRLLVKAYNLQMQLKGILLSTAGRMQLFIENTTDENLKETYRRWQKLRELIADIYTEGLHVAQARGVDVKSLEQEANRLEKILSQHSAQFAANSREQQYDFHALTAVLKPGEAALELIRIEPQPDSIYYIGLIARPQANTPTWFVLTDGKNIERHVNYYRNAVKFKLPDRRSYEVMWAPIQQHLQGVRRLYFSADGAYYQINPYALYDTEQNRYVVDEIELVWVSNTKYLIGAGEQMQVKKEAVLIGNPTYQINASLKSEAAVVDMENQEDYWLAGARFLPLPGTEVEVNQIAELLQKASWKVKVFKGAEAREEHIKTVHKPGILHIATHGFFIPSPKDKVQTERFISREALEEEPIDPMLRSGLVLAGVTDYFNGYREGRRDDGVLTAYEATQLDLSQTQLVVLSACETGLGKVQNGEGVYGLQRAFLLSGANYLVMSLWRVDDAATQQLMSRFYDYLMRGEVPPSAFKKAQLELRQRYPHPYFWAAFVLIEQ